MLLAGEQSTWPKLLFIANRMKIERLIQEGLLIGGANSSDSQGTTVQGGRESMHLHGQAMRNSAEPSPETEDDSEIRSTHKEDRRLSVRQEIRRQSGLFFDDVAVEEETDDSGIDEALANGERVRLMERSGYTQEM